MCLVGQPLLSVLSDAPQHFISGSRINIEMKFMLKSLYGDYILPLFFFFPTSNCIYSKYVVPVLFIYLFFKMAVLPSHPFPSAL